MADLAKVAELAKIAELAKVVWRRAVSKKSKNITCARRNGNIQNLYKNEWIGGGTNGKYFVKKRGPRGDPQGSWGSPGFPRCLATVRLDTVRCSAMEIGTIAVYATCDATSTTSLTEYCSSAFSLRVEMSLFLQDQPVVASFVFVAGWLHLHMIAGVGSSSSSSQSLTSSMLIPIREPLLLPLRLLLLQWGIDLRYHRYLRYLRFCFVSEHVS